MDTLAVDFDEPVRNDQEVFFDQLRSFVSSHETSVVELTRSLSRAAPASASSSASAAGAGAGSTALSTMARGAGDSSSMWDMWRDTASVDLSMTSVKTSIADTLGAAAVHNALFYRTVLVLVSMRQELKALVEECTSQLIPPIALFGDGFERDEEAARGFGHLMPLLMDIWNWRKRCIKVAYNTVQQLSSLYDDAHETDKFAQYQTVNFVHVWLDFFDLLGAIAKLEEVIAQNDVLHRASNTYRLLMENVKRHPDRYDDPNIEYIDSFGKLLAKVDEDVLGHTILTAVVGQRFDSPEATPSVNQALFNEAARQMEGFVSSISYRSGSLEKMGAAAFQDGSRRGRVPAACAGLLWFTTCFESFCHMTPKPVKDLTASIFQLRKTSAALIPILGIYAFKPCHWLAKAMPHLVRTVSQDPVKEGLTGIQEECSAIAKIFEPTVKNLRASVAIWTAQMQSSFANDRASAKRLVHVMTLLIQRGVQFGQEIQWLVINALTLHETADASMRLSMVHAIGVCVELQMIIRRAFHAASGVIATMFPVLTESFAFSARQSLMAVYQALTQKLQGGADGQTVRGPKAEAMTDQQCAAGQALMILSKPLTPQALSCLDVVLSVAFKRTDADPPIEQAKIEKIIHTVVGLRSLCNYQRLVVDATDCQFLYWQRDSCLPLFLSALYEKPSAAPRMLSYVQALHDSTSLLLTARHLPDPTTLVKEFSTTVRDVIKDEIMDKLYAEIEADLRLHAHSQVLGQPYKGAEGQIKRLAKFTNLPPFRFFGEWFHIQSTVEDYLDVQFYNLNALHPNDWETYEEMRTLARERYDLKLAEGFLPGSIVDQGLDVLTVTKNIHVFVANYTYNLNEQLFVQRPAVTETKHLHTLHIRHVANSIRTHGTGIMNTTVNYVYKCLLKKLAVVSQFLYDGHIRSKLLRDSRFFTQKKGELNGRFPVQRVDKLTDDIRKLGATDDGRSYIDQFRILVSEIGNALGYMRIVRSGGLRSIADSAVCVPDIERVPFFEKCIDPSAKRDQDNDDDSDVDLDEAEAGSSDPGSEGGVFVGEVSAESVRTVDSVVENMTRRLAQGSDYFSMLSEAIAKKLNDKSKYGHLKMFHMIIPAMCQSFVEATIAEKDRLTKKNKEGVWTDDGFALGCVFLLSLLGLEGQFDSLHWFESVGHYYTERRAQTMAALKKSEEEQKKSKKSKHANADDNDWTATQTMQLTLTMVESTLTEYGALEYAFNCCKVFFTARRAKMMQESDTEEEDGEGSEDDME